MNKFNNGNLKLAVQKEGRLTSETLSFLRRSGLEFESYRQKLFSTCRNFPLEIIFVRDNDIPNFVSQGIVDLGIIGQNLLFEKKAKVKKLLNLRYGFCSLVIAVPKESDIREVKSLSGKKVATSYPISTGSYFKKLNIPVEIVDVSGSLEITPTLGVADVIVDLTSTGSTIALNDLRVLSKIYDSEAVLVKTDKNNSRKKNIINKLLVRFKGVLSAKNYKYIFLNAKKNMMPKIRKIIPGLRSQAIFPLAQKDWVSVASAVKEDIFWETIEKLKANGATGIFVLPIEKIIT